MQGLDRAGEYEDVTFDVHAGEILGLTGLLGSGRTELALSLFGMNPPDRRRDPLDGGRSRCARNRGRDRRPASPTSPRTG